MQIIGHKQTREYLEKSLVSGCLHHAYIFYGPKQVGKRTLSHWFAKKLLCSGEGKPCGTCSSCLQFDQHIHPDVSEVEKEDEKKGISVKQIRSLIRALSESSFYNGYKIGIVHDAHTLNVQASNALLKTLEEPVKQTILFLTTTHLDELLPTIVSRCQKLYCPPLPISQIYDEVMSRTNNHDQARVISRLSNGKPGSMIRFLQEHQEIDEMVSEAQQFIQILNESDLSVKFKDLQKLMSTQSDVVQLCDQWILLLNDVISHHLKRSEKITFVALEKEIEKTSANYSVQDCQKLLSELLQVKQMLFTNVSTKMLLENYLLNTK